MKANKLKTTASLIGIACLFGLLCGAYNSPLEALYSILATGAIGMAVTANQLITKQEGCKQGHPVAASTTIYQGTLVYLASGYADDDTNSGANQFAGIAIEEKDNSSGSAGDLDVDVWQEGVFELVGTGFTQGTVGSDIYGSDNYTVTTTSSSNTYIGRCVGYVSSTKILVKICVDNHPDNVTAVDLDDDEEAKFGTGDDASILWSTGDASNHALVIALGNSNQGLHITDLGAKATDWNISATTHPNVYIHSNTTPATDYLRLGDHDGTEADIDVVGGTSLALKLAGTEYASVRVTGLAVGSYVAAATAGTDQVTIKSTGTAPAGTGADVGHLYADFESDDDELFWLSGTVGTASQLTT